MEGRAFPRDVRGSTNEMHVAAGVVESLALSEHATRSTLVVAMAADPLLDTLWNSAPSAAGVFAWQTARLEDAPRRYLEHAIAAGTPLASAVWLRMHGEIKLGRWFPFRAEQVIRRDGNMIWAATVTLGGLPLFSGFDRLVDGAGVMEWKLLGLFPMIRSSGPDISRSAAGRLQAESIWLPSRLCAEDVTWTSEDSSHAAATMMTAGVPSKIDFTVDPKGRATLVRLQRWGNPPPDTKQFRLVDFGAVVEEEATFGGYTIPTRIRAGWHVGSAEFESGGEFFRGSIEDAVYR